MPSFVKRNNRWVIRFSRRGVGERKFSFPGTTPKAKIRHIEAQMNLAYRQDWNPFTQTWEQYNLGYGTVPLGRALSDFKDEKTPKWSKQTQGLYRQFFRRLSRLDFDLPVDYYKKEDYLKVIMTHRSGKQTEITRKRMLNNFFSFCRRNGYAKIEGFTVSRHKYDHFKYITEAEFLKVVAAYEAGFKPTTRGYTKKPLRPIKQSDLWKVMFYQGLRAGETVRLRVGDVDQDWMHVKGKGGKARNIPVRGEIKPIIEYYKKGKSSVSLLFGVVSYKATSAHFKKAVRKALPPNRHYLHLHSLRHGCGTYLAENGVPISFIRDFLGHSSITTTEIYAKVRPMTLKTVIDGL